MLIGVRVTQQGVWGSARTRRRGEDGPRRQVAALHESRSARSTASWRGGAGRHRRGECQRCRCGSPSRGSAAPAGGVPYGTAQMPPVSQGCPDASGVYGQKWSTGRVISVCNPSSTAYHLSSTACSRPDCDRLGLVHGKSVARESTGTGIWRDFVQNNMLA